MNAELARVNTVNCGLNNFPRVSAVLCELKITVSCSLKHTGIYLGDTARLSAGTEYFVLKVTLANFSSNISVNPKCNSSC